MEGYFFKDRYMKLFFTFLALFTYLSCSHVNKDEQEYYQSKSKMRHGIIPLTAPSSIVKRKKITFKKLSEAQVERGKQVYLKNCYHCHGIDGKGNGPKSIELKVKPRNLINVVKEVPNFKFFMAISQWQGKMPGWINALNEQEVEDVNVYIQYLAQTQQK